MTKREAKTSPIKSHLPWADLQGLSTQQSAFQRSHPALRKQILSLKFDQGHQDYASYLNIHNAQSQVDALRAREGRPSPYKHPDGPQPWYNPMDSTMQMNRVSYSPNSKSIFDAEMGGPSGKLQKLVDNMDIDPDPHLSPLYGDAKWHKDHESLVSGRHGFQGGYQPELDETGGISYHKGGAWTNTMGKHVPVAHVIKPVLGVNKDKMVPSDPDQEVQYLAVSSIPGDEGQIYRTLQGAAARPSSLGNRWNHPGRGHSPRPLSEGFMNNQGRTAAAIDSVYDDPEQSGEEGQAFSDYEANGYNDINGALRSGMAPSRQIKQTIKHIDNKFGRARPTQSTMVLYRGMRHTPDVDENGNFTDLGYSSMSNDQSRAKGYAARGGSMLHITFPAGSNLISLGRGENEVLAPRGSQFRVVRSLGDLDVDGVEHLEVEHLPARIGRLAAHIAAIPDAPEPHEGFHDLDGLGWDVEYRPRPNWYRATKTTNGVKNSILRDDENNGWLLNSDVPTGPHLSWHETPQLADHRAEDISRHVEGEEPGDQFNFPWSDSASWNPREAAAVIPDESGIKAAGIAVIALDTGRVLMQQRALNPIMCPCGMGVTWDEMNGYQHDDGSVSHDGEHYGQSVSDLLDQGHPEPTPCPCCQGRGDNEQGSECSSCDGSGVDAEAPLCTSPCREIEGIEKTAMPRDEDFLNGLNYEHHSGSNGNWIDATDAEGNSVGGISWHNGVITGVDTVDEHQNKGLASELLGRARDIAGDRNGGWVEHDWGNMTPSAIVWAERMGESDPYEEGLDKTGEYVEHPASHKEQRVWMDPHIVRFHDTDFQMPEDNHQGQPMADIRNDHGAWEGEMTPGAESEEVEWNQGSGSRRFEPFCESCYLAGLGYYSEDQHDADLVHQARIRRGVQDGWIRPHDFKATERVERIASTDGWGVHTAALEHDPNEGTWEFPGGKLDPGESPRAAAIREFREEVGQDLPPGVFVGAWVSPGGIVVSASALEEPFTQHQRDLAALGWKRADPDGYSWSLDDPQTGTQHSADWDDGTWHLTSSAPEGWGVPQEWHQLSPQAAKDTEDAHRYQESEHDSPEALHGQAKVNSASFGGLGEMAVKSLDPKSHPLIGDFNRFMDYTPDPTHDPMHRLNMVQPGDQSYGFQDHTGHTAPSMKEGRNSLDDMEDVMPDYYDHPEYYNHGSPGESDAWLKARKARGNPDKKVRIYRAVPHGISKIYGRTELTQMFPDQNPDHLAEWVSTSKEYALLHARAEKCPKCGGGLQVISGIARAGDILNEGYPTEYGYIGDETLEHSGSNRIYKTKCPAPRAPRQSTPKAWTPRDPQPGHYMGSASDLPQRNQPKPPEEHLKALTESGWRMRHPEQSRALPDFTKLSPSTGITHQLSWGRQGEPGWIYDATVPDTNDVGGHRIVNEADPKRTMMGKGSVPVSGPEEANKAYKNYERSWLMGSPHGESGVVHHFDPDKKEVMWQRSPLAYERTREGNPITGTHPDPDVVFGDFDPDWHHYDEPREDPRGGLEKLNSAVYQPPFGDVMDFQGLGWTKIDPESNHQWEKKNHGFLHEAVYDQDENSPTGYSWRVNSLGDNQLIGDMDTYHLTPHDVENHTKQAEKDWYRFSLDDGEFAPPMSKTRPIMFPNENDRNEGWGQDSTRERIRAAKPVDVWDMGKRHPLHPMQRLNGNRVDTPWQNPDGWERWKGDDRSWTGAGWPEESARHPSRRDIRTLVVQPFLGVKEDHFESPEGYPPVLDDAMNKKWQPEDAEHPLHHLAARKAPVYKGFIYLIQSERDIDLGAREHANPDDPDGDMSEQSAWWEIGHAKKNPALRKEVKQVPWAELELWADKSVRANKEIKEAFAKLAAEQTPAQQAAQKWLDENPEEFSHWNSSPDASTGRFDQLSGEELSPQSVRDNEQEHQNRYLEENGFHYVHPASSTMNGFYYRDSRSTPGMGQRITAPSSWEPYWKVHQGPARSHGYSDFAAGMHQTLEDAVMNADYQNSRLTHEAGVLDHGEDPRPKLPDGLKYYDQPAEPYQTQNDDGEETKFWRYSDPGLVPPFNESESSGYEIGQNESHRRSVDWQPMIITKPQSDYSDEGHFDRAMSGSKTNVQWDNPICETCYLKYGATVPLGTHSWAVQEYRDNLGEPRHEFKPMTPDVDQRGNLKESSASPPAQSAFPLIRDVITAGRPEYSLRAPDEVDVKHHDMIADNARPVYHQEHNADPRTPQIHAVRNTGAKSYTFLAPVTHKETGEDGWLRGVASHDPSTWRHYTDDELEQAIRSNRTRTTPPVPAEQRYIRQRATGVPAPDDVVENPYNAEGDVPLDDEGHQLVEPRRDRWLEPEGSYWTDLNWENPGEHPLVRSRGPEDDTSWWKALA